MKILWSSNPATTATGYGTQTAIFAPRIRDAGHDVALYQSWGGDGIGVWKWEGMHVYPGDQDWGNRTMAPCAAHHGGGDFSNCQVIALLDAWVLRPNRFPPGLRLAVWAPVDHHPLPPAVKATLEHPSVRPIAMSRFGERMMQDAGLDPLYVPHGIDTSVFRPQPERKAEIRADLGLPADAFVVGMVAANKSNPACDRKAYPQVFQAFAELHRRHPDTVLYCHTNQMPQGAQGLPLRRLANACGIPEGALRFSDPIAYEWGLPASSVADLYAAFDVLANPSLGEGFGIPIVEAQACGVPVIATDHSAMTELCHAGWLVGGDTAYDALQEAFWRIPSIADIAVAFEAAYECDAEETDALARKARTFALGYDADRVFETYWRPALDVLAGPREVPPLPNRAQRRAKAKAAA
jgi:glycosyltransferase involved in cell wall biosynthesis